MTGGKSYYSENHTISGGLAYSHEEQFSSYEKRDNQVTVFGFDVTDWSDEHGMNYFNKVVGWRVFSAQKMLLIVACKAV